MKDAEDKGEAGSQVANPERDRSVVRYLLKHFRKGKKPILVVLGTLTFHLLGLLSSVDALMTARTTQGTIAWVVSLNTFPYLAVPGYWIFGRTRFNGYVTAWQASDHEVQHIASAMVEQMEPFRFDDFERPEAARAAELLAKTPVLFGNDVELLIDGEATFDSIFSGIRAAEEYVLFQFFIVKDDDLGRKVKELLIAKQRDGVPVYFLYDEVGSHALPTSYLNDLREVGVEVFNFHSRKGPRNRLQINFRNHRKVVVVDGDVAWIGGHNVGDEYLGKDPKFGHWRDTHVRIEGPSAIAAQLVFFDDWHWASNEILELDWTARRAKKGNVPVLIIASGPADELETAHLMFIHAINSAEERIWISSPYFVPDEGVMAALQLAGLRGVDVRILIPDNPDHMMVYLAAFSYFEEAAATGVRFYKYTNGFLHQKAFLIDDRTSSVGTANFDNRSFRLNFEITAMFADADLAVQVEEMFEEDFANSRLVQSDELENKSFLFKVGVRLSRLTSPIQ